MLVETSRGWAQKNVRSHALTGVLVETLMMYALVAPLGHALTGVLVETQQKIGRHIKVVSRPHGRAS